MTIDDQSNSAAPPNASPPDDFAREVYGILGLPVDDVDMATVLGLVENAAGGAAPFLLSTANLNFLVTSRTDAEFRESLLLSDLCTADGMPIVWAARLLGIPLKQRVAGSDIFEALKSRQAPADRLKLFVFGGAPGVANALCQKINVEQGGMVCAGFYDPGIGTVEDMSTDAIIGAVNASGANFLAAALGAKKGQAWLLQNHDRLRVPVRVHLGATINFQAGTVRRAPMFIRNCGLEWLWRIKEEPQLSRRYWNDGIVLLGLLFTHILPLLSLIARPSRGGQDLVIERNEDRKAVLLRIHGDARRHNIGKAIAGFREAAAAAKPITINFTNTRSIDARFIGLLLMLKKRMKRHHLDVELVGMPARITRFIRLSGFEFLLSN